MKESGFIKLALILGLTAITLGFQNCSQTMQFSSSARPSQSTQASNGGTTTDNPKPTVDVSMGAYDPADVQSADLCLGEIRMSNAANNVTSYSKGSFFELVLAALLKPSVSLGTSISSSSFSYSGSSSYSNSITQFRQSLGNQLVSALPSGTYLQPVTVPPGTYDQVEIRLSDSCANTSLALQNRQGRISLRRGVTMRFVGSLSITATDQQLRLNLAPIMSALGRAHDAAEAEDALDHTDGGL